MPHTTFDILLEQPLIISQQAASAGAHQSLDYLPGSTLLGLAASRLYATLTAGESWTLFHSGQVRFGDALPLAGDETGLPMPLCWHTYKGEPAQRDGELLASNLFDPSARDNDGTRQPVQLRGGYATPSGQVLNPTRQQTLKTAIDRQTGMAAESQLFGYEALTAGQRFRCVISADDSVPAPLWLRLQEALTGQASLGRSRSAQFGRVRIEPQNKIAVPQPSGTPNDTHLTLWLLSDLLLEEQGQPCLIPHPHLLGLPEGSRWLSNASFLRSRRYSAYNAYRRHYDSERQVITRGSVLRFELPHPLTTDEHQRLQQGLGLQIEAGLGSVWVNPPLLASSRPEFRPTPSSIRSTAACAPAPSTQLIASLRARQQRRLGDQLPELQARSLFDGLCQRIREARRYAACTAGVPVAAPERSQWGRLKQGASDYRNAPAQLWHLLSNEQDGLLRERSGWQLRYGPLADQTLSHWLLQTLQPHSQHAHFSRVIGHMAVLGLQPAWLDCCAGTASEDSAA